MSRARRREQLQFHSPYKLLYWWGKLNCEARRRGDSHELESFKPESQHPVPARYRRIAGFGRRAGDCLPCRTALSTRRFYRRGRFFRSLRLSDYKPSDEGDFFVGKSEFRTLLCTAGEALAPRGVYHD